MDTTRCSHCKKRMKAVMAENGRTEFRCLHCDLVDPIKTDAVKWAQSPLAAPDSIPRRTHCGWSCGNLFS